MGSSIGSGTQKDKEFRHHDLVDQHRRIDGGAVAVVTTPRPLLVTIILLAVIKSDGAPAFHPVMSHRLHSRTYSSIDSIRYHSELMMSMSNNELPFTYLPNTPRHSSPSSASQKLIATQYYDDVDAIITKQQPPQDHVQLET